MELKNLVEKISLKMEKLLSELSKTDNKSAMRRCRKRTLELEKLFKSFRKETIKKEKGDK